MDSVEFTGPGGSDPAQSFRLFIADLQPQPSDLKAAGQWLVEKRRKETLAGVAVNGGGFAPYSPRYALQKRSAHVNLYSARQSGSMTTEHMLDLLTYKTEESGAGGVSSLDVGIFGNADAAMRAQVMNEGATIRSRIGTGLEGFKTHPGRRQLTSRGKRGKSSFRIPARNWLGATDADLAHMQQLIADSMDARVKGQPSSTV